MNTDEISISSRFGLATARDGLPNCEGKGPRFSFVMIVLNGMPFIEYSLKSIYDFAYEIIIVEGAVENCMFAANADGGSTDGTAEFIESFPDPQGKIKLIRGRWPEKCEMQNEAIKHVTGNYVWLIDSDEVYKKEHLERINGILRSDPSITQVNFIPDNFWKGLDYIFVSRKFWEESCHYRRLFKYVPGAMFSTHRPPTMVWRGYDRTTEQMNLLDGTATREMGIVLYHYSYVLDEQVKQKVELYRRYGWDRHWKLDLDKWYEDCFLKWTPENRQEIDSAYPIWTGDINSRTQLFTGTHPEVMRDFNREQFDGRGSQRQASRQSAQTPGVACLVTAAEAVGQPPPIPTRVGAVGPRSETAVRNILWIRTDSIGDAVLSSSMLPHIRRKWENARITVVCQEHIGELYEACPDVDDIVTFSKKQALQSEYYREEIIKGLRALKPDLSLNSVYSREALTDWFALNCGAKRSYALDGNLCNISRDIRDANNRLYTEVLPSGEEHKPELERHEDFLRGLGVEATGLQPMVWTRPSDDEYAEQIFADYRLDPDGTIALFAGAQYDCRVYEGYGEALAEFCRANHLEIVALGTGREQAINQRNLDATGVRAVNLSGKTTVLESAAVLKRCRLALGAETGLAHICCAVGTPNVILVGGGHFGRFMPYSPLTSVSCLPLDCFGCNWDCRYKRPYCVKDVAPAVIAEALQQSFKNSSRKIRVFMQSGSLWESQGGRPDWKTAAQFVKASSIEVIPIEAAGNVAPVGEAAAGPAKQEPGCDVSIVLCTKDRAELLDRMLSSLEEAAGGIVYELIVVEGGSADSTLDVLRRHNVWHVYDELQCLGPGRHSWPKLYNFGFSKALGKWAMYASDDIIFSPNSIARAVKILDGQREEVAGGVFFYKNLHPTRREWAEYGIDFTRGNKLLLNYGLVRLDHFRECGGLEECYSFYCADTDLCYKLCEGGRQLIPLSGCFVTHDNLLDVQKRANAGRSARDIEICRRRWRHLVPADDPKPTRLLWREDFAEAFNVPRELERIDCGIESFWHGLAYFGQGMFAEAEQQFMQAVQSQCDHRQVLWYLALAADKCQDNAVVEKAATGVVRLAPDFQPAMELLLRVTGTEQYSFESAGIQDTRHRTQDTRHKTLESGVWSLGSGDAVGGGHAEFQVHGLGWDGGEPAEQASPVATAVKMARRSDPDHSEMELRREIGRFNKVVVWGLKTSEHTHSHIHRHFFETLEKVAARAVFADDRADNADVIGRNDLVIAVDVAISHLPVRNDAYYCLHNCPEEIHRRIAPARNIRLATYTNYAEQAGERWDEVTFFDSATRTLFQPWATNLLAREFKEPVVDRSGRIVFWVGSIWNDALGRGNVNEIQMLRDVLETRGIRFVHLRGISDSLNIRYVRNSLIAPAIVGRWQVQNNYLPCRMWKNISYGQLGISNVAKFADIFEDCAVEGESIEELIDNALNLPSGAYRDMTYRQQEIVRERHTYVNRLMNIIKAFESIQNY